MHTVTIDEAKSQRDPLLDPVEAGERVITVDDGRPAAELVPAASAG